MFRLLIKLCLFLPLFLGISLASYLADPGGNFPKVGTEQTMSELVKKGKAVISPKNFEMRYFNRLRLEDPDFVPHVVALGSSRSNYIVQRYFPGKKEYTIAVNSGTLPDFIEFYALLSRKNPPPAILLIEVSPFTLRGNFQERIRRALTSLGLNEKFEPIQQKPAFYGWPFPEFFHQFQVLTSPSYFQSSLSVLYTSDNLFEIHSKPEPYNGIRGTPLPGRSIVFPDGSMQYAAEFYTRSQETIRQGVRKVARDYMDPPFSENTDVAKSIFEHWISYLLQKKTRVAFYFPPYHPIYFEEARLQGGDRLTGPEMYFMGIARKYGIKTFGAYRHTDLDIEEGDLFDFHHPRESALDKIFKDMPAWLDSH